MYIGSWKLEDLVTFYANTKNFSSGNAQDADTVPYYRIYEDETGTPLITGVMALLDATNTMGFYSEQFTVAAASGFEKGKSYSIYMQAVVAGVTGTALRSFQIEAEVDANRINWGNLDNPNTLNYLSGTYIRNVIDPLNASIAGSVNVSGLFPAYLNDYITSRQPSGTVVVNSNLDKSGYSLSSPQNFDLIGNISGTLSNVLNVINPVGISTGSLINAIADQVWDEQLGGHLVTGSAGRRLNDAASAGSDPWATSVPASYTPGQAGYILGSNLDVPVSSRLASGTFASNYVTPPTASQNAAAILAAAALNPIDANVQEINDTELTGDGSTTPWGPV